MPENTYFLYYLKLARKFTDPSAWDPETLDILEKHREFLNQLGHQGKLVFAGRTDFDPGDKNLFGIALIRSESMETAKAMMAGDPAVIHGIQESEVYPYRLALNFFRSSP